MHVYDDLYFISSGIMIIFKSNQGVQVILKNTVKKRSEAR